MMAEAKSIDGLVPVKVETLERGDLVYEEVRFGMGPSDVKYNKWKVVKTNRGAVQVTDLDGKRTTTIRAGRLFADAPSNVTSIRPATVARQSREHEANSRMQPIHGSPPGDDQYAAWLDMGRSLVDDIANELRGLVEQKSKLLKDVEGIDQAHRKRLDQLEKAVAEAQSALDHARRDNQEDKALAMARLDTINAKIEHVNQRKSALEAMLGGDK